MAVRLFDPSDETVVFACPCGYRAQGQNVIEAELHAWAHVENLYSDPVHYNVREALYQRRRRRRRREGSAA